ncbi:MAG: ribonuclease III [Desulfobacteraceae bacterium]|nr:ribonuclease III [Desulfobacteraceae bacterium]
MESATSHLALIESMAYRFSDPSLLEEALRHSSFVNEQGAAELRDNERLEFLGDAVLNLAIGRLLMDAYPQLREGDLSRIRANLVNETQLANLARGLALGQYIQLGKGESQTGGHEKNSILANAMEAVIAAIYIDGGFDEAFAFIHHHFRELILGAKDLNAAQDFKSRLQEAVQGRSREVPRYRVIEEQGPDHDKIFCVVVTIGDLEAQGQGKSKKLAEQDAARNALTAMSLPDASLSPK